MRMPALSTSPISFSGESFVHHVGAFDDHVGRGEVDIGGAHRLDGDEADVPVAGLGAFEHLARRLVGHELHRHVEPLGKRRGEIGRDALRLAARALLRQHRVAEVDRGAELAGRRKILQHLRRRRGLRACGERRGKQQRNGGQRSQHFGPPVRQGLCAAPRYAGKERDMRAARKRQNWNTAANAARVPVKFQGGQP